MRKYHGRSVGAILSLVLVLSACNVDSSETGGSSDREMQEFSVPEALQTLCFPETLVEHDLQPWLGYCMDRDLNGRIDYYGFSSEGEARDYLDVRHRGRYMTFRPLTTGWWVAFVGEEEAIEPLNQFGFTIEEVPYARSN